MDGFPKAKKMKKAVEEETEENEAEQTQSLECSVKKDRVKSGSSGKDLPDCSTSSSDHYDKVHPSNSEPVTQPNQCVPNEGLSPSISDELLVIEQRQCSQLLEISYPSPVTHVYNPLSYATQTHQNFVRRYGNSKKKVLFLGMNPGPFGMAQNGVPFGDTTMVKEFLGVSGVITTPSNEHPKRTIQGLECTKNEVSGTRFWNLVRELCSSPEVFFKNCYVHNYCPLCFMAASGKNITPPMLRTLERRHLEEICNESLVEVTTLLGVEFVVGVGKYAEERARAALTMGAKIKGGAHNSIGNSSEMNTVSVASTKHVVEEFMRMESLRKVKGSVSKSKSKPGVLSQSVVYSSPGTSTDQAVSVCSGVEKQTAAMQTMNEQTPHLTPHNYSCHGNVKVYGLMHPSPINPAANKGWNQLATSKFNELGLLEIIKGSD